MRFLIESQLALTYFAFFKIIYLFLFFFATNLAFCDIWQPCAQLRDLADCFLHLTHRQPSSQQLRRTKIYA